MTYRTTSERPTIRSTSSERLRKHMRGGASIFDSISYDDLIMAFFPCIYFCENNQLYFTGNHHNLLKMPVKEKSDTIIERSRARQFMYELCLKMFAVCDMKDIRLVVENPYATQHYLVENFPYKASFVDRNRALRGDFFNKPTQYWFVKCEPTNGFSEQPNNETRNISSTKSGTKAGICSQDRSMISPDYARNFICDFILGKEQVGTQLSIF